MTTTTLRIGSTDVILYDYELNKGKIIISDDNYGYNFAYYWGAMGDNLSSFIQSINSSYVINKLSSYQHGSIDMAKTMKAVREWWKDESGIKWYEYTDIQKEIRELFNSIQNNCESEDSFIREMSGLASNVNSLLFDYKSEYKWIKQALNNLSCEPWHFIEHSEHKEHTWLRKFLPALQKELKDTNS